MAPLLFWLPIAALLSHNLLLLPVASTAFHPQNYYSPDPNPNPPTTPATPSTPTGHPPPTGSHHHPSHGSPPPSHGSGGGNCRPSRPSKSPPHHRHKTPTLPSPPSGDGYYNSPPPTPPAFSIPPSPIVIPVTPSIPSSPPPFGIDPNNPPFTCVYWGNHPGLIWGLLGWWGTVGGAFGVSSLPGLQADTSLQHALSNTRADGFGALYREGTASFLNSMADPTFPFTTKQVKDTFSAALTSNKAAAAQARLFKLANEKRLRQPMP